MAAVTAGMRGDQTYIPYRGEEWPWRVTQTLPYSEWQGACLPTNYFLEEWPRCVIRKEFITDKLTTDSC